MSNIIENYPIVDIPFLYKYGLTIQNSTSINGTLNPETKLSILSGVCRDDEDITDIRFGDTNPNISGFITSAPVRIDNTINGPGGLDQGNILASTMYAIYIISDSRGYLPISAVATLALNIFSVPPGPLMPAGYDCKRLIGFWATDINTFWLTGYYYGLGNDLVFTYDVPQETTVTAGSSNTYANVNLFNFVPEIYNSPASIYTVFTPGAAGDTLTMATGGSTAPGGQIVITGQVSGVKVTTTSSVIVQRAFFPPFPLPLPSIQYKVSGTDTVAIYVAGFSISV
jgi:hypothetical protein